MTHGGITVIITCFVYQKQVFIEAVFRIDIFSPHWVLGQARANYWKLVKQHDISCRITKILKPKTEHKSIKTTGSNFGNLPLFISYVLDQYPLFINRRKMVCKCWQITEPPWWTFEPFCLRKEVYSFCCWPELFKNLNKLQNRQHLMLARCQGTLSVQQSISRPLKSLPT